MNQSIKIFLGAMLGLWFLFLGQTFLKQQDTVTQIIGRAHFLAVKSEDQTVFWWGERNESVLRQMTPFFGEGLGIEIISQEEPLTFSAGAVEIKHFSENFVRGHFGNTQIFFIGEGFDSAQIKAQPLTLESDFWVLQKSQFPNFMPAPKQAILFLGERTPGKKLTAFSKEKNVPLLSIQETGGFVFKQEESGWNLSVQR